MHLDILYKSVVFMKREKIETMLYEYKQEKVRKQKEEEERLMMQTHIRKLRGRSGPKRDKSKDESNVEFETHTPIKDEKKSYLNQNNMNSCAQDESGRKMFFQDKMNMNSMTTQNPNKNFGAQQDSAFKMDG